MLHFALPSRHWGTQQVCQVQLCLVFLFFRSYQKRSQVKHGSSWVWPTQLVNPYFTENTQPGHTSVNLTARWSSSSNPDIHQQNYLPLFFHFFFHIFSFLLSVAAAPSAMKHLHEGPTSLWQWRSRLALMTLLLSHTLYRSLFLKRMLSWTVRTGCQTLLSRWKRLCIASHTLYFPFSSCTCKSCIYRTQFC